MKTPQYETICLMLPTYKRVNKLMGTIDSALKYADDVNSLRFCFCVNENDTETIDFLNSRYWPVAGGWEIIKENTKQPNLSLYFNLMYDKTQFVNSVVSEIGDDMLFLTKGYDTRILEEINKAEGKVIVYCDDNYIAHDKCCVNLFTTRELVTATHKPFMCEFFHADMIDMVWTMVGAATGTLRYLSDVIIFHNHSTRKPEGEWDETFKRLSPVQKAAGGQANQRIAFTYAMLCARNLIESGVGQWNTLS